MSSGVPTVQSVLKRQQQRQQVTLVEVKRAPVSFSKDSRNLPEEKNTQWAVYSFEHPLEQLHRWIGCHDGATSRDVLLKWKE